MSAHPDAVATYTDAKFDATKSMIVAKIRFKGTLVLDFTNPQAKEEGAAAAEAAAAAAPPNGTVGVVPSAEALASQLGCLNGHLAFDEFLADNPKLCERKRRQLLFLKDQIREDPREKKPILCTGGGLIRVWE